METTMNRRRITHESVTEGRKPGSQKGRMVNTSCHSEGFSPKNRKDERPCDPSLTLRMTGASEVRRTGSQEGRLVNEIKQKQITDNSLTSCHPDLRPSKRIAFTLAEVLITLGIIGVVAALTIPNMVTNYQKKATVAKLKEDYAVFQQAFRHAKAENGDYFDNSEYTTLDKTVATFDHYLKPYLKISKLCIPSDSSCWTDPVALNGVKETYMSSYSDSYRNKISMILLNGQTAFMWASGDGSHFQIWVNVNGLKNKAIIGKDVFGFLYDIGQGTLKFIFTEANQYSTNTREDFLNNSTLGCNKNITGRWAGTLCGALIEHDGWKISKDYPW